MGFNPTCQEERGLNRIKLGHRLKDTRDSLGMTRVQLADATGLNTDKIRSYESGKAFPPVDVIALLSETLSVTIDYLVKGVEEPLATIETGPTSSDLKQIIRETHAIVASTKATFGIKWEWVSKFELLLADIKLLERLKPTWEELQRLKYAYEAKELFTNKDVEKFLLQIREKNETK